MADAVANFAKSNVSTGYDAAATTVVLAAGGGAKMPAVPFNATWWNVTDYPDPCDDPNVEIIRVTAKATDTLTVTRAQEGTAGSTKNTGGKTYRMVAGVTAKTITDLAGGGGANTSLSNLAGVAVNSTLEPGSDQAYSLGSEGAGHKTWDKFFGYTFMGICDYTNGASVTPHDDWGAVAFYNRAGWWKGLMFKQSTTWGNHYRIDMVQQSAQLCLWYWGSKNATTHLDDAGWSNGSNPDAIIMDWGTHTLSFGSWPSYNYWAISGIASLTFSGTNASIFHSSTEVAREDGTNWRFLRARGLGLYHAIGDTTEASSWNASAAVTTTDATVTNLWTRTLADNTVYSFEVVVSARRTDSGTENARFVRNFKAYRQGGGATVVGAVDVIGADDQTTMSGAITVDASGNDVRVRVTGQAAKSIKWLATVRATPVS